MELEELELGVVYNYMDWEFVRSPENGKFYQVAEGKYIGMEMEISSIRNPSNAFKTKRFWKDLTVDEYSQSRIDFEIPLVADCERENLNKIIANLASFEEVIKKSVTLRQSTYSNSIIIAGMPGTGKTHNTVTWLDELQTAGVIGGFNKVSGKITPLSLFKYLEESSGDLVQLMDDCDIFQNVESLNLLKSALDTKSEAADNRQITYGSKGAIQRARYESFMIIITNELFENPNPHVAALLDRVHLIELPFTTRDMHIFTLHLIEKLFQDDLTTPTSVKLEVRELLLGEIQEFVDNDLFKECRVNFSVRFVMKIVDLIALFGNRWKSQSREYKKLTKALESLKILRAAQLAKESKKTS